MYKILLALLILNTIGPFTVLAADREMKIGVLAFRGDEAAKKMWSPMANYLTANIPNYDFTIVPLNLQGMRSAASKQSIDFVLTNPGSYVDLEASYGASRLATLRNLRQGDAYTVFSSVILTRADRSDIKTLKDLRDRSFMAVSKKAFGGFQMAWRELKDNGIDPFRDFTRIEFAGFPQDNIVYAVRDGLVDAGTVRGDTLERMAQEGKIRLSDFHVLNKHSSDEYPFSHSTRLYPEWPFAKLKHTPEQLGQQVAIALLTMSPESEAATSGRSTGWTIPLDYGSVHELFRTLEIGPYKELGEVTFSRVLIQYWRWLLTGIATLIVMGLVTTYVLRINRRLALSQQILKNEIGVRKQAQDQLARHSATLELRVKERTRELQEDILERVKAEEALRRSESTLRRLHEITTSAELEFDEKSYQLLEMGCEHFELQTGLFSKIQDGHYKIVAAFSHGNRFIKDSPVPLDDTLCKVVLSKKTAVAIEQIKESEYSAIPMVQHTGLECYFGAAVRVAGKNFGTLCFSSTEYRDKPFSSVDKDILQLMAQWIGEEIERQNTHDESRRHQDALAHVARLGTMGEMASALAHELNQPLTAIVNYTRGCIRRLQSRIDNPDALTDAMEQAVSEAERAAEIIRGLREFVRKDKSKREPININTAVSEVARIAEVEVRNNGVILNLDLQDTLPEIDADMIQIEQVILNLVRNGLEAMSDEDTIVRQLDIQTTLINSEALEVIIRDTGHGLPEGSLEEVFHPFFTTKDGGMGMGLSISRSIIEAHGGRLHAESTVSGGSTFRFTLPAIAEVIQNEA